jgi:hypothetical protein
MATTATADYQSFPHGMGETAGFERSTMKRGLLASLLVVISHR